MCLGHGGSLMQGCQTLAQGIDSRLSAAVDVQFGQDIADMGADCGLANAQTVGNLAVAPPNAYKRKHRLRWSAIGCGHPLRRMPALYQPGDGRMEGRLAIHLADGLHHCWGGILEDIAQRAGRSPGRPDPRRQSWSGPNPHLGLAGPDAADRFHPSTTGMTRSISTTGWSAALRQSPATILGFTDHLDVGLGPTGHESGGRWHDRRRPGRGSCPLGKGVSRLIIGHRLNSTTV